jgi:hypothetical protein
MTAAPVTPDRAVRNEAGALVDLGLRACEAYRRPDLAARLAAARRALVDPAVHIVVVGDFKQGKSSLVNALLGAACCPVDDNVATAVPTYLRHGPQPLAELTFEGDPPRRQPIPVDEVPHFAVEGVGHRPGERITAVEIRVPCDVLADGLVLVDTPGVGGLGSAYAPANLAALSMADAALFVTDAERELTQIELDFLRQARELCGTVVCVLTKTDFYPAWRTVRGLNERHLSERQLDVPVIAVSSPLRSLAVETGDAALNEESGFAELIHSIGIQVQGSPAAEAAAEVVAVCDQIAGSFEVERAALGDPAAAHRMMAELGAVTEQTLAGLTADLDRDLLARLGRVLQEADDAIDGGDPADTWPQMTSWLQSRVSHELIENYALLCRRANIADGTMGALKRAYGGVTFTTLSGLAGLTLDQINVGISLVMGHQGLRAEKERQLFQRRTQASNAVRRYCDEVTVFVGRDTRDALHRIQRQLGAHYSVLAQSNALARDAIADAAKRTQEDRTRRIADLDAALARLSELRRRSEAVAG